MVRVLASSLMASSSDVGGFLSGLIFLKWSSPMPKLLAKSPLLANTSEKRAAEPSGEAYRVAQ